MTNNIYRCSGRLILAVIMLAGVLSSCGKDPLPGSGNTAIKARVASNGTKGGTNTTVSVNVSGSSFSVHAYLGSEIADAPAASDADKDNYHFIDGQQMVHDGSKWNWSGDAPVWRNSVTTTFWSFYPTSEWSGAGASVSSLNLPDDGTGKPVIQDTLSFNFNLPADATATPYNDAVNQKDLMLAYNNEIRSFNATGGIIGGKTEFVDIRFFHALSKIRFDVSGVAERYSVAAISIDNVSSSGYCKVTVSDGKPVFTWNPGGSSAYRQDFVTSDFNADGSQKEDGTKFFFMVPQMLAASAGLTVTFLDTNSGSELAPISKTLSPVEWKAGKYYTYKISYTGEVLEIILSSVMDIDSWVEDSETELEM